MGKGFVGIALAASFLTGCGAMDLEGPLGPDAVEAQTYKGVDKAMTEQVKQEFAMLDKDRNKFIDPAEFGVATPQSFIEFARIDSNNDGKITINEMQPGFFATLRGKFALDSAANFLFSQLDRNRDDLLVQFEVERSANPALAERFAKYARQNAKVKEKALDRRMFQDLYANATLVPNAPPAPPQEPTDPGAPPQDPNTPPAP